MSIRYLGLPALAALTIACGGQAEGDRSEPTTLCGEFCAIKQACGYSTAACLEQCAWADGAWMRSELAQCHSRALSRAQCVLEDMSRLQCAAEHADVRVEGCLNEAPRTECEVLFLLPTSGGFSIAPDANGACPWTERQIGMVEAPTNGLQVGDGMQTFLGEMENPEFALPERAVSCAITENQGSYHLSLHLQSGGTSFTVVGDLDGNIGEVVVSYRPDEVSPEFISDQSQPCSIEVQDSTGNGTYEISRGYVAANFECPSLGVGEERCAASGRLLFEGCTDLR